MAEATEFKPALEYVISDLETLKVLADPLRLRILELLRKPGTVKRVAQKIDRPPTKLYYHFNLLEKHSLITMVDTRIVSGIVEKHFQASARSFRIEPDLLSPGSDSFAEGLDVTLNGIFGDVRNDLLGAMLAGKVETSDEAPAHRRLKMHKGYMNLTPERAEDLYGRLQGLIEEFAEYTNEDELIDDPDARPYSLLLLLHPSMRPSTDFGDDE